SGGVDYVGRFSAGAESDQDIPSPAERGNLAGKDCLVAIVVGDGGQDRRVGSQGQNGPWLSFATEPADELPGQVLRLGCTSAVAADEHEMPRGQSINKQAGRAGDVAALSREQSQRRTETPRSLDDDVGHAIRAIRRGNCQP